jgi:hypothetical protein
MAITPIIGHKRTHSEVDSDGASADAPAPKQTTRAPPRVLLVHLSTLLSCRQAIIHAVRATVPQVLLDTDIPEFTDEDVLRAFSRSPMLSRFLYKLAGRKLTPNEEARLRDCYPRIYYQVGAPLLTLAPHAKEFLEAVKRRDDIALAVISSNPTEAVETLIKLGVGRFVDTVSTITIITLVGHPPLSHPSSIRAQSAIIQSLTNSLSPDRSSPPFPPSPPAAKKPTRSYSSVPTGSTKSCPGSPGAAA